ncbi:MAG: NAD-dependent malic enzyme, partial [Niameybacter sp.]
GIAITKLLLKADFNNIIVVDKLGILCEGEEWMNWAQQELSKVTNKNQLKGSLKDALIDADIFIGVSAPNIVSQDMVSSMNKDAIIFAMANPTPEIMPDLAKEAGALVVGTGRSDFPNQVNNVLVFPGIFKGALLARVSQITEDMKLAAAYAIASMVKEDELGPESILPAAFREGVADCVAEAVKCIANKEA